MVMSTSLNINMKRKVTKSTRKDYYITFMNDFNSYGYAYLVNHKHEVFKSVVVMFTCLNINIKSLKCSKISK
jgi:hypothetical protein